MEYVTEDAEKTVEAREPADILAEENGETREEFEHDAPLPELDELTWKSVSDGS